MSCQLGNANSCAHEATKALTQLGIGFNFGQGTHQRMVNGFCVCSCGYALRAKEVRNWAAKGTKVNIAVNDGKIYVIYEERNSDGQGHIYINKDGNNYGNGNYNWNGADKREIYRVN